MAGQGQAREDGREARKDAGAMPAGVRRALWAGVGLLLASALYLIAVRGDAILAGLTTLAQMCF
jgi:hypothetical protein